MLLLVGFACIGVPVLLLDCFQTRLTTETGGQPGTTCHPHVHVHVHACASSCHCICNSAIFTYICALQVCALQCVCTKGEHSKIMHDNISFKGPENPAVGDEDPLPRYSYMYMCSLISLTHTHTHTRWRCSWNMWFWFLQLLRWRLYRHQPSLWWE